MTAENSQMSAKEILETYFLDNRARLLEIASFFDRIDRCRDSETAKDDFRYKSFVKALKIIIDTEEERTKNVQMLFSDLSAEPIESVVDPKAYGAWEGASCESD